MPRTSRPFFRSCRNSWYARVGGKVTALGIAGRGNRKQAEERYAALLLGIPVPPPAATTPPPTTTVADVVAAFLADAAGRVSRGCLHNYRQFLTPFSAALGHLTAATLSPTVVEEFAESKAEWSATYKSNFLATVTTCFRSAVRRRQLPNSIPKLHRPRRASRGAEATVTATEYEQLREAATPLFRDYLTLLWWTGARPSEIAGLTAEMVAASANGVVPLTRHKTAHHGKTRMLLLTGEALAVATARAATVRGGLLFPGNRGQVMSAKAINNRIDWLCQTRGIRKVTPYGFRHAFATDALTKGIPDATVAALLGHSGTAMLHKHYSHLLSRTRELVAVMATVRGG